mmetsp:Transcript_37355/g.118860  ORF Transcript_37355/g.118860 Transcript_37355/m.118860 type:complete len:222 (-) Transcript_37355:21-686(-)
MLTMESLPSGKQASFTGDPGLVGVLVEELAEERVGEVAARGGCGLGGASSGERAKWRCTRPFRTCGGMLPCSQTRIAPTRGGCFCAHWDALPNWRWESQRTTVHAGRATLPCSARNCMHGCASRQSVRSTNIGRGDFRSHSENWLAFFRQTREPPRPWRFRWSAWQRASFSRLWQRSWHQTSRHQPLALSRSALGCRACLNGCVSWTSVLRGFISKQECPC